MKCVNYIKCTSNQNIALGTLVSIALYAMQIILLFFLRLSTWGKTEKRRRIEIIAYLHSTTARLAVKLFKAMTCILLRILNLSQFYCGYEFLFLLGTSNLLTSGQFQSPDVKSSKLIIRKTFVVSQRSVVLRFYNISTKNREKNQYTKTLQFTFVLLIRNHFCFPLTYHGTSPDTIYSHKCTLPNKCTLFLQITHFFPKIPKIHGFLRFQRESCICFLLHLFCFHPCLLFVGGSHKFAFQLHSAATLLLGSRIYSTTRIFFFPVFFFFAQSAPVFRPRFSECSAAVRAGCFLSFPVCTTAIFHSSRTRRLG